MAALETDGLSKSYNGVAVVDGIDLRVPDHSVYAFLGPNGAGKTTTMKMVLGLIRPSAGSGSVFGLDIVADSVDVRRRVGYLPQEPRFYPHMTARETLAFAAGFFFSGPESLIAARVDEMLELVDIADKADRPIKSFSGGEMQRLGIAQAQIHEPELLVLDEPAAALDPLGRRDVLAILGRFTEKSTVFYSTHILEDVQRVSDTVCILNEGRVIAQGPIGDVLSGGTDTAYSVTIDGDADSTRSRLLEEQWVSEVLVSDGGTKLRVTVTDADIAQAKLQRLLLADQNLIVKEFTRTSANLEDVFVGLIEGETHDGG
jgi:ABC-2 type transport system ATP-binding protein